MNVVMWEERVQMGPAPAAATGPGGRPAGMVVPLAGWRVEKIGRYLSAAFFALGGLALAGVLFVLSAIFSMWGSTPGTAERLIQFACIGGGFVFAAAVLWPVLGGRGPELVLDEHFLRFHHPDLISDMLIERSSITAIHAGHGAGRPLMAPELGLNAFDGSNLEMVFRSAQRIPRARFVSQLSPLFSMRNGREVPGLRLRVADVDWARQVFGTMPQYRALTDADYEAAGIDLKRRMPSQLIGVAMVVVAMVVNILRHWVF